jgi:regulator of protease activity HflC (stomatin/prohibitin superfamily)
MSAFLPFNPYLEKNKVLFVPIPVDKNDIKVISFLYQLTTMTMETKERQLEKVVTVGNGWTWLGINLLLFFGSIGLFIYSIWAGAQNYGEPIWWIMAVSILIFITSNILWNGLFTLEPNEARVLVLFGSYKGTVRESGFHFGNPFYTNGQRGGIALATMKTSGTDSQKEAALAVEAVLKKHRRNKISLRARNLNGDKLKVNDKRGNPVEIAVVVVWRVRDTAQAMFDVDDYEHYVQIQSEAAVRHVASLYGYDQGEEDEITLRGNLDEVSSGLTDELQERLQKAGVIIEEARITHLAYAPEIAQAMLRRQQAEAIIAARQKIVHGAVGMVEMALNELSEKDVIDLDEERKASMVSNLLVVLCGESEVHPVVNTGTLYN